MQSIWNLDKWTPLVEGKAVAFERDEPRKVRLEVNAAGNACLYALVGQETRFVAFVQGRDVVEFVVPGKFGLVSDGDPVWIYTIDGDRWTYVEAEPVPFTRIHVERARSPELELMVARMQANMEKRLATQAQELGRLLERRAAAGPPHDEPAGSDRAAGKQPTAPKGAGAGGNDKASGKPAKDTGRRDDEAE